MPTTTWTRLVEVPANGDLSAKTSKAAAALNARINGMQAARSAFDLETERVLNLAPELMDDRNIDASAALPRVHAGILRDELQLRKEIGDFFGMRKRELHAAAGAAEETHREATVAIKANLVEIGYRLRQEGVPDPCAIEPGFVMKHPTVFDAMQMATSLRAMASDDAGRIENEHAIEAARNALTALVKRLTGVGG
jgi:hypothetical protein